MQGEYQAIARHQVAPAMSLPIDSPANLQRDHAAVNTGRAPGPPDARWGRSVRRAPAIVSSPPFTRLFETGALQLVVAADAELNSVAYRAPRALATIAPAVEKLGLQGSFRSTCCTRRTPQSRRKDSSGYRHM